ncbi:FkbM family methyltransferase [Sulfidibacter corallicola]|uniref:FkbM family methyltransferase n=1 Tax=Sulfidibacter corallicola TaxID=2818388 RepID=A0A8A4TJ84_SULCO|nr:FkbM family methyltransferase [Sulfidibacter corallicola]QTD50089.1 FkbM family methyltransferase [Sulfidibacter corallicola]
MSRFMSDLYKTVRYILEEPSNRGQRTRRIFYFFAWQLFKRLIGLPILAPLENGLRCIVYPWSEGGCYPIYVRLYDSQFMTFIRRFSSGDGVLVDVGSNIGLYTLLLAKHFRGGVAFEPTELSHQILVANLALNRLGESYRAAKTALGSTEGTVTFEKMGDTGKTNKISSGNNHSGNLIEVPITRLDTALTAEEKARLEFLKIDVEGFEIEVLRGAVACLAETPIRLVLFERLPDTPIEPLRDFFKERDWTVFTLDGKGRPSFDEDAILAAHDLFAVPPHQLDRVRAAQEA